LGGGEIPSMEREENYKREEGQRAKKREKSQNWNETLESRWKG